MPSTFYFIPNEMVAMCEKECTYFIGKNTDSQNTLEMVNSSYIPLLTLSENNSSIDTIKKEMSITDTQKYDYHSMILKPELHNKNTLWLYRNVLFYYVFIFVNDLLQTSDKLNAFYNNSNVVCLSKNYLVDDKSPINPEDLKKYKISNFGSATPTSDIDASIQYDGEGEPHISFLLSLIEDTYLYLFNISCLQLDIEFYDSYISKCVMVENPVSTSSPPPCKETYIVDGRIDKNGYDRLLKYAAASMIRNVYIALNDNAECKTLLRSREDRTHNHIVITKQPTDTTNQEESSSNKFISLFTEDDYKLWINILTIINSKLISSTTNELDSSTTSDNKSKTLFENTQEVNTLLEMLSNIHHNDHIQYISNFCKFFYKRLFPDTSSEEIIEPSFTSAKTKVDNYFYTNNTRVVKSYDDQRTLYYEHLKKSEEAIHANTDDKISRIAAFSESQIYRQEGYVSVLTVMHIPRYYQKCGIQSKNPVTDIQGCSETCNIEDTLKFEIPSCLLDEYAYKISMVEQLGFMLRFAVSYILSIHQLSLKDKDTQTNIDTEKSNLLEKYTIKIKKYNDRYAHALFKMSNLLRGGKRLYTKRKYSYMKRKSTRHIRPKRNVRKTRKPRKTTKN